MTNIWVYAPNTVVSEAIAGYIRNLGFRAQLEPDPPADVAVWNLCGQHSPFLPPPPMPTLALLCFSHTEELTELLRLGYRGYHRPDAPPEDLPKALRALLAGEVWAERHVIAHALTPPSTHAPKLTPKETQVMSLLSLGLSNKQIAYRLGNSETTVKSHVSAILEKLGAKNRVDLLLRNPLQKS